MTCPSVSELEALDADGQRHVQGCAKCQVEARWLELERELVRQRAAREEVAALRFSPRRSHRRQWVTATLAAAVAGVLVGVLLERPRPELRPARTDPCCSVSDAVLRVEMQSFAAR
jgi:ferric-dicitrate binding protein FerR (iron transport regulator)